MILFHNTKTYYHSIEDTKYQGIDIGEKRGREESFQEIAKTFHIPYEEIKEKTNNHCL